MNFIETERLTLRKFTTRDLPELIRHRSDKDVMEFLGGIQKPEVVQERLKVYAGFYEKNGYSMCAVFWKETGEFIGVGGLLESKTSKGTEVGYTVDKKFWGKGIATECTKACLEFGFHKANLDKIIALTHPKNLASRRVLEKAGMNFEKNMENMGETWVQYAILREKYDRN